MRAGPIWPLKLANSKYGKKEHRENSLARHRTFSGKHAAARKQTALYVTERCVFSLCEEGLELAEIAPGVDLARDILAQMDFAPIMRQPPRLMDERIFLPEPMGLRESMLSMQAEDRRVREGPISKAPSICSEPVPSPSRKPPVDLHQLPNPAPRVA